MADRKDTQGAATKSDAATVRQDEPRTQEMTRQEQAGGLQGSRGARGEQALARFRDPFAMMQRLSEEMDELFDSFFYRRPRARGGGESAFRSLWAPDIEVCEEPNQLRLMVDLPGVQRDDVKIDVEEGVITIQGERREERTEGGEEQGYRRSERRYGSFYRSIPLPEGADAQKAEAHMKDGVLEITVPMTPRKQARRLEIQG